MIDCWALLNKLNAKRRTNKIENQIDELSRQLPSNNNPLLPKTVQLDQGRPKPHYRPHTQNRVWSSACQTLNHLITTTQIVYNIYLQLHLAPWRPRRLTRARTRPPIRPNHRKRKLPRYSTARIHHKDQRTFGGWKQLLKTVRQTSYQTP
jgi:hypothetical protein